MNIFLLTKQLKNRFNKLSKIQKTELFNLFLLKLDEFEVLNKCK